jgi:xanthine dehydrogenase YagR molybdenum-binding subunit
VIPKERSRLPDQGRTETYVIPRENHNPIEMHATIAAWDGDRLTLWDKNAVGAQREPTRSPAVFGIPARERARCLSLRRRRLRLGLRTWPHVTLAALGARVAGRPVK